MKKRKGFTMMEILIVVGIIAAIIAVVGYVATTMLTNSRREACWGNIKNIETAAIAFYTANANYPDEITDLASYISNTALICPVDATAYTMPGVGTGNEDITDDGKLVNRTAHNHGGTIPF